MWTSLDTGTHASETTYIGIGTQWKHIGPIHPPHPSILAPLPRHDHPPAGTTGVLFKSLVTYWPLAGYVPCCIYVPRRGVYGTLWQHPFPYVAEHSRPSAAMAICWLPVHSVRGRYPTMMLQSRASWPETLV